MSTSPLPVDTSLSISIDPATLDAVRSRYVIGTNASGEVMHPAFLAAYSAFSGTFQRALNMSAAESSLREQRHHDPASQRRLRAGIERNLGESQKAIGGALETIATSRAKVVAGIDAALQIGEHRTSLTHSQRAGEVRAALRSMGQTKALEALRLAIRDGRVEAVASALSADALAVGLTANDLDGIRYDASRRFAPQLVEEGDALDALQTLVARAGDSVTARFAGVVGKSDDATGRSEAALRALESEVK